MSGAYYNENDPKAAAWLRELIKTGAIAPGEVDERGIADVRSGELAGFTQCHFFAGIGGWSYALRLAGWSDDRPVWTGSCPCQPFSQAGRGLGTADERHLWPVWRNLIAECRPATVFGEQVASPAALHWLALVQDDMEGFGYAFAPFDLPAAGAGAPQIRQRVYFVAESDCDGRQGRQGRGLHVRERRSLEGMSVSGRHSEARELGDSSSAGGGRHTGAIPRTQSSLERGVRRLVDVLEPADAAVQLGDTDSARLPLGPLSADGGRIVRIEGSAARPAEPVRGFWSGADWIACRDGKWRPVEPGTFPLAHGFPCRVGLLRGYGNAISPEIAAQFIAAYLEVIGD